MLEKLYLIEFLHQTTTWQNLGEAVQSCILLNFYIKPQLGAGSVSQGTRLYLIEFLHQTTTLLIFIKIEVKVVSY